MDDLAARGTIGLAEEAGCALHVVHVATGAGVALVTQPSGPQGFTASDDEPAEYLLYEDADRDGF
jgi:dihydroorotase-like cyclic amidohydrolase